MHDPENVGYLAQEHHQALLKQASERRLWRSLPQSSHKQWHPMLSHLGNWLSKYWNRLYTNQPGETPSICGKHALENQVRGG